MPAFTADFFGSKNLGANYGLVFLGWGLGFLMPLLAGYIKDSTGSYSLSFYISAAVLIVAVILSRFLKKPHKIKRVQRVGPGRAIHLIPGPLEPSIPYLYIPWRGKTSS